jgi:ATP-binding cassette subfamily C (CFTR/MRP) protein 1
MIFDDVFSALDKSTAKHVFTHVFSSEGLLHRACTTIIMVSQSPLALCNANHIVVLSSDGRLTHQGTWEALVGVSNYIRVLADVAHQDHHTVSSSEADNVAQSPKSPARLRKPKPTASKQSDNRPAAKDRRMGDLGLYKTYANAAGNVLTVTVLLLFTVSAFSVNFPSKSTMERVRSVRIPAKI